MADFDDYMQGVNAFGAGVEFDESKSPRWRDGWSTSRNDKLEEQREAKLEAWRKVDQKGIVVIDAFMGGNLSRQMVDDFNEALKEADQ